MKQKVNIKASIRLIISLTFLIPLSSTAWATPNQDLASAYSQLALPLSISETPKVNWSQLEAALNKGANPNTLLSDGTPLLYLVALSGNAQLFKLMLAKGARLETNPAKAPKPALFEYALKGGNLEIIRFLLGKGFASSLAEKTDALIFSAFSGHLPLVKYWLDSGVPVDAVKGQAFQEGATALMWAASSEKPNLPVMQYLIAQGAQPKREDERKNNLLHWAGHSGQTAHMQFCLKYVDKVNQQDIHGFTPLMIVSLHDSVELLGLLVQRGADLHLRNEDGDNALLLAGLGSGNYPSEVFYFLIEAGSDVNSTAKDGMTALLYSISNHDIKSLELLLKKGARTHCKTPQGESPLQLAIRRKEPEMIRLLKQRGVK